jgi:carbamoyl-phosphate synthase large subunit
MNNILITSAGRRVSLVSYFQKEAKRFLGDQAKVFTTDLVPEMSSACLVSDKGFKVGRFTDSDYMDQILSICKDNKIGLIIPTIDTELLLLTKHRAAFQKEGIHIIVSDINFITVCRDKRNMNKFFAAHGFKLPKMVDRNEPTFPLFIKPINGSSSQNIFLIKDKSMLSDFHINNMDLMFMEYLPKERYEEYTIDLYYDNGGNLKCVVPRIRIAVRGGETNKGITCKNKLISIVKNKLGTIEGARGCLTLQVFLDKESEDIYGIEINPRFGGGYPLSYLAGANYPAWIIQEYLQNETIEWFDDWEDKLLLLRHDQEMIVHDFEY